jgi:hypothetical protein
LTGVGGDRAVLGQDVAPWCLGQAVVDRPTEDPAAVLQWRIEQHIDSREPSAHVAEPHAADINWWRSIIEHSAPRAAVEDSRWNRVWQHAAAGATEGLDADAAIHRAAVHLAATAAQDPMDDDRYTMQALIAELAAQRQAVGGARPALPWLARPDYAMLRGDPELTQYLTELNAAMTSRVGELREQVAREQPIWTAGLGPRSQQSAAAARWDELAGLAAAYRETYHITSGDPAAPLGPQPDSAGVKSRAWKVITNEWRPPVTTPELDDDLRSRNQQRIDALQDRVITRREATAVERAQIRTEAAEETYRYDEDEQLDEDTDFHSGLSH